MVPRCTLYKYCADLRYAAGRVLWWFVVDSRDGKLSRGADIARTSNDLEDRYCGVVVIALSFRDSRRPAETAWCLL